MIEKVLGYALLIGSSIGSIIGIYRYFRGARTFGQWQGGGKLSLIAYLSFCMFFGSIGAAFLGQSPLFIIPCFLAWLIGFSSQSRAKRKHHAEENELRRNKAIKHPGIFEVMAPANIDLISNQSLDLYDAGACTYLGRVNKSDLEIVIRVFSDMPDQGENDIFFIHESSQLLPLSEMSAEFKTMIDDALTHRDYLILRWMLPDSNSSSP